MRYTIVTPEKAALLAESNAAPVLIDEATGKQLPVPTSRQPEAMPANPRSRSLGRMMRQVGDFPPAAGKLLAGRTYSMLVPNWGGTFKAGSSVTLLIGDARMERIAVQ